MRNATLLSAVAALALLTAVPAVAQTLSDDKIKIGVLTDLSGTYSDLSGKGSVLATEMAIADFGGKLNGKAIEVVSADHQNKADIASSVARKWYDAEQVDMITDLVTSATALAVREVSRERNKIDIVTAAATTALTNKNCSKTGFHWVYDTYSLANGTGLAVVKGGGDSWFFITADYAFGHALEKDTMAVVASSGGSVKGSVRHPFPNSDFSSFLLQAQGSGAKVIGLANAGQDTINAIKQAAEFGITQSGQKLAALLLFSSDVHALGLKAAQGLLLTTGFYHDQSPEARKWSEKFRSKHGAMPTMAQAGTYSAVLNYLNAVKAAGTDDGLKVADKLRGSKVNDMFAKDGLVREDGRMVHDMYLAQVKKPEESKEAYDYFTILRTIPGKDAYQPLDKSTCELVKKPG